MNILPHKSWHVRTKENIARVRKDQAKAAEEEAEKQKRVAVADYEARINLLRKRSNYGSSTETTAVNEATNDDEPTEIQASQHVDLFADHENKTNKVKPMDEEKRLEQEKYEKQIGYLTYLGQDTNEALGTRSWYDIAPKRNDELDDSGRKIEIGLKTKHLHDPMLRFLKNIPAPTVTKKDESMEKTDEEHKLNSKIVKDKLPAKRKRSPTPDRRHKTNGKKSKKSKNKKHKKEKRKRKHSTSDESDSESEQEQLRKHKMENIQKLREQRLQREKIERERANELLRRQFPALLPPEEKTKDVKEEERTARVPFVKQKYNSQFNPYLAKQNYNN